MDFYEDQNIEFQGNPPSGSHTHGRTDVQTDRQMDGQTWQD